MARRPRGLRRREERRISQDPGGGISTAVEITTKRRLPSTFIAALCVTVSDAYETSADLIYRMSIRASTSTSQRRSTTWWATPPRLTGVTPTDRGDSVQAPTPRRKSDTLGTLRGYRREDRAALLTFVSARHDFGEGALCRANWADSPTPCNGLPAGRASSVQQVTSTGRRTRGCTSSPTNSHENHRS
jgi:hypothetical protein